MMILFLESLSWFFLVIDEDFQKELEKTPCCRHVEPEIMVGQVSENRALEPYRSGVVSSSWVGVSWLLNISEPYQHFLWHVRLTFESNAWPVTRAYEIIVIVVITSIFSYLRPYLDDKGLNLGSLYNCFQCSNDFIVDTLYSCIRNYFLFPGVSTMARWF